MLELNHAFPWLEERIIILGVTGSYAYGTNTPDSDKDYKGVCIPPIDYYLGLNSFNEYNTSGGKNFRNTKDDVDINILHINKFVLDAMKGVPNNIELLFLREEDYLKKTELGEELINNRHLFLSKNVKYKFGGYAQSQIKKMLHSPRKEYIEKYGYDTKFFMHAVRLLTSCIEILKIGDFSTYRPNREFLIACREGKFKLEEAIELIKELQDKVDKAYEKSELPEQPDINKINELLIAINLKALQQGLQ